MDVRITAEVGGKTEDLVSGATTVADAEAAGEWGRVMRCDYQSGAAGT
jgi:hypothetical protein